MSNRYGPVIEVFCPIVSNGDTAGDANGAGVVKVIHVVVPAVPESVMV